MAAADTRFTRHLLPWRHGHRSQPVPAVLHDSPPFPQGDRHAQAFPDSPQHDRRGMMLAFAAVPFSQAMASHGNEAMQQSSDNQTVPDKAADAWITTKVKSEFGTTKGVHATEISVSTNDGVVTLSGTVGSTREKMHAVRVAKKVKGVKSVDAAGLTVDAMKSHDMKSGGMPSSGMSSH